MNAIEQMKAEISKKAREEAEGIIERAEKEAKAIIEKAYSEFNDAEKRVLRETAPELSRLRREITGAAVSKGRRKVLRIKEAYISEVFDRVEREANKLAREGGKKYEDFLLNLVEEGATNLGEQKILIEANRRDSEFIERYIDIVKKNLMERLGMEIEVCLTDNPLDCIGGVIVSSMDRALSYYNTLESRIAESKEKLRLDVAKTLFEE